MKLPNANRAFVDPNKVRDYLLSPSHPIGRFKAAVFLSLGYGLEQWSSLHSDMLQIARMGSILSGQSTPYGTKYEIDDILTGPSGRSARIRTVWIVRAGEEFPRFVTAFPR